MAGIALGYEALIDLDDLRRDLVPAIWARGRWLYAEVPRSGAVLVSRAVEAAAPISSACVRPAALALS